jgi:PIN domain nuclease of toxin-antitoxin system
LIWWLADDPKLPPSVAACIEDPDAGLFVSVGSLWEMTIKASRKGLQFGGPVGEVIPPRLAENAIQIIEVLPRDLVFVEALAFIHRDPFDRLFVAQAQARGLTLVTGDPFIARYPVPILWG